MKELTSIEMANVSGAALKALLMVRKVLVLQSLTVSWVACFPLSFVLQRVVCRALQRVPAQVVALLG